MEESIFRGGPLDIDLYSWCVEKASNEWAQLSVEMSSDEITETIMAVRYTIVDQMGILGRIKAFISGFIWIDSCFVRSSRLLYF